MKKKRFFGILLSFALMLTMMPVLGLSLTAYAEPAEELLTTITAVGASNAPTATSANVSYSTEDIATLTFSQATPDGYGLVSYQPTWGWWGYGITLTVTPVEGYTITKCKFYDDANRDATDSEAPFVVETTEEDKTPQVNGTPIKAYTSKGIKKIEVYGYATPDHTHNFTYSASGATITATCSAADCTLSEIEGKHIATLTIAAPLHTTYGDGKDATAVITDANNIKGSAEPSYFEATKSGDTYTKKSETALSGAPTDAGDYIAEITLGEANGSHATASVGYTIAKANPTATPPTATAKYKNTLAEVTLTNPNTNTPGDWAWVEDGTTLVGNVGNQTHKANFTPTDTANYNSASNVDVSVTVSKADARELFNILVNQTYTMTAFSQNVKQNMPSDAGEVSYNVGTAIPTGSVSVSGCEIDANYNLNATLSNGEVGNKVKVPITISSTNYADSSFNVVITLTDKQPAEITTLPAAKNLTANGSAQELVTA